MAKTITRGLIERRPSRTWEERNHKIAVTQAKLREATSHNVTVDETLAFITALTWAGSAPRIS